MTATRLQWDRPAVRVVSPTLAALARLQAGTSDTPIYDQLRVELAARRLQPQLAELGRHLGIGIVAAMAGLQRAMTQAADHAQRLAVAVQLAPDPETVLDRIRADQRSLDWQEAWRAERDQL